MGILPSDFYSGTISSSKIATTTTEVPLLQDYLIDLATGHLVVSDSGQFIIVTGLKAVIMQMWRKLHTTKGLFSIYSSTYGNTLDTLKGKGKSYADLYVYKIISDCIIDGIYVKSINNFTTELTKDKYVIAYTINTIYGDTSEKLDIDLE